MKRVSSGIYVKIKQIVFEDPLTRMKYVYVLSFWAKGTSLGEYLYILIQGIEHIR